MTRILVLLFVSDAEITALGLQLVLVLLLPSLHVSVGRAQAEDDNVCQDEAWALGIAVQPG